MDYGDLWYVHAGVIHNPMARSSVFYGVHIDWESSTALSVLRQDIWSFLEGEKSLDREEKGKRGRNIIGKEKKNQGTA